MQLTRRQFVQTALASAALPRLARGVACGDPDRASLRARLIAEVERVGGKIRSRELTPRSISFFACAADFESGHWPSGNIRKYSLTLPA